MTFVLGISDVSVATKAYLQGSSFPHATKALGWSAAWLV